MARRSKKTDEIKLDFSGFKAIRNWNFWNAASKWYFFPKIYLLMVIIITLRWIPYWSAIDPYAESMLQIAPYFFIYYLWSMFLLIAAWILPFIPLIYGLIVVWAFYIISIVFIVYYKKKHNKILKPLIIILTAMLLISFIFSLLMPPLVA